jgi:MrcB-like, N-terminal domain/Domain of unknown function (DUF3883)
MTFEFKGLATETLELQKQWSHENSIPMQRRGVLVRAIIPTWIENNLQTSLSYTIRVQGRDGTGRKTEIPWVRLFNTEHSLNAREGWYCVLLFQAQGDGFYLALAHGSTRWENGTFKPRSNEELSDLVTWARGALSWDNPVAPTVPLPQIDLGAKGDLGDAYQRSTAACIWYPSSAMPSDEAFLSDLRKFLSYLGALYEAEDLGRSPESASQQAREIVRLTEEITRPKKASNSRQGFGLRPAERFAVEQHAMRIAEKLLKDKGFEVTDVSKKLPYDLLAKSNDGKEIIVEVKGSTGAADSVILTANEVTAHRTKHPHNMLIVVHSISLDRKANPPKTAGGACREYWAWDISSAKLEPLSFQCFVAGSSAKS